MKTNQNPRIYGVFYGILKKSFLLAASLWLIFSCSDADQLGLDLIDDRAKLHTLDTLTIKAITVRADSVATSLGRLNVLGVIDDPVFGKSRASTYTETRPPTVPFSFGEDPELESVNLLIAYSGGYYGSIAANQTIRVYELSENFPESDTLYSNSSLNYHPELITLNPEGFRFRPAPADSVEVNGVMRAPHIRIPLTEEFGQKFLLANDTEAFESIPDYLEQFKGLYITVDEDVTGFDGETGQPGKGGMVQLEMFSPFTAIEFNYRNVVDTLPRIQPLVTRQFPVDQFARHSTRLEHFGDDGIHEALRAQVVDGDHSTADSLLFLQTLGRLRVDIDFPYLDDLVGQTWLINKAELIVPVEHELSSSLFPAPAQLLLLRENENEDLVLIDDYLQGVDYFGGVFDQENSRYVFNISQYFQKLVDGEYPNTGLSILISRGHERMSRVVLHGPGRQEEPMQLLLYYSVFD